MKVVLVMCDGIGDAVARARMGYLEHLTESGLASRFVSRAVLPTASRMNYETIHTGLPPHTHGITSNHVVRRSSSPNLFTLASEAGLKTAAVAFYFISELYHKARYDPLVDTEYDDTGETVDHTQIAPTICDLLGLNTPDTMTAAPIKLWGPS